MANKWFFQLITDQVTRDIDELTGWTDAEFEAKRDATLHGVSIIFGLNELTFDKDAGEFVKAEYQARGVDGKMSLRVWAECSDDNDKIIFDEMFSLDFARYSETCGDDCAVSIGIEQKSCVQTFNNRFDQKVSLDATTTFDQTTPIVPQKSVLMLPPKTLIRQVSGQVAPEGDRIFMSEYQQAFIVSGQDMVFKVRPNYAIEFYNAIKTGNMIASYSWSRSISNSANNINNHAITPQLMFEDTVVCFNDGFNINYRMKGRVNIAMYGSNIVLRYTIRIVLAEGEETTHNPIQVTDIVVDLPVNDNSNGYAATVEFDVANVVNGYDLQPDRGIFAFVQIERTDTFALGFEYFDTEFDEETFIDISADSKCPPTPSDVHFIHEALDHVIQSISDKCLTLKSDYYGRADLGYPNDGCGGLRVLTSGLKIRNADNPSFFLSLKDALESLRAIDNIGMDIHQDQFVRLENVRFFYQDFEMFRADGVNNVQIKIATNELFNIIRVGYDKWEAETVNSLDEFNSTREFRPSMNNVKGTKDIISKFIAGGYPLELTRIQNFAATGGAVTKFDNDTFIICIHRTACVTLNYPITFTDQFGFNAFVTRVNTPFVVAGHKIEIMGTGSNDGIFTVVAVHVVNSPFGAARWRVEVAEAITPETTTGRTVKICPVTASNAPVRFEVEQDNVDNDQNIIDPESIYNFRISPVRNLMRHFKTIGGMFPDHTTGKLIFMSGTGNYVAAGEQYSDICKMERGVLSESEDVSVDDFLNVDEARPIMRPEIVTFEYPMSIEQFNRVRANPYGLILYRCNSWEPFRRGFLISLKYNIANQHAVFELRNKY